MALSSVYEVCGQGVLYKDARFMAAFPSICRTRDGELLVVFRRAPDSRWLLNATFDAELLAKSSGRALEEELYHWDAGSHLVCLRFDQELVAQGEVCGLSVDGQSADQDASLLLLDNGDILLASFSWYAMPPAFADLVRAWGGKPYGGPKNTGCTYIPWGSYLRRTCDSGNSWDEREYLPPLPGDVDLVPGIRMSHGGGCRGQIISRGRELFLASYAQIDGVGPNHSAHLYVSSDEGKSWAYRTTIAASPEFGIYEPSLSLLADGTIVCWMRTDDSQDRIASTRSVDGGQSFGELVLHEAAGHPSHGLVLKSGQVFLCYGYRQGKMGIRARLLDCDGGNIDSAEEIILRDDGACSDLGYPWAVELDSGAIAVCYYFSGADGVRHIAYSLVCLV